MQFDSQGNIFPYTTIPVSLSEFEEVFCNNDHRKSLLVHFYSVLNELRVIVDSPLTLWIDGSFATKKIDPRDIDVVAFIPFEIFKLKENQLSNLKRKTEFVDLYYIKKFPEEHANHQLTWFDQLYWLHFFSSNRKNKKKGFLELNF